MFPTLQPDNLALLKASAGVVTSDLHAFVRFDIPGAVSNFTS